MVQCHLHGPRRAFAIWRRGRHVICIGRNAVSSEFTVDLRSARLGMLQFLHHYNSRAFADDETVSLAIKRSGSAFRLTVARAERFHCGKSSEANLDDGCLGAPGEENVGVAKFNNPPGFADSVV